MKLHKIIKVTKSDYWHFFEFLFKKMFPQQIPQSDAGGDDRYYPSDEELKILIPKLKQYFSFPDRSMERKNIVQKTFELIKEINPNHWDARKVRIWFRNNKKTYISVDPERIPTAQIPSIPAIDPNFVPPQTDTLESRGFSKPAFSFVNENAHPKIDFGIPNLPELTQGWNSTQEMYQTTLQDFYTVLKQIREKLYQAAREETIQEKLEKQKKLEKRFNECIEKMHKQLTVENIFSFDSIAQKVYATTTKQFLNEFSGSAALSCTEGLYRLGKEAAMVSISQDVSRNEKITVPPEVSPNYSVLYKGRVEETITDIPGIQTSAFLQNGEIIYTYYDQDKKAHCIRRNDAVSVLGCFQPATSMVVDESDNKVWVSAECRVFGVDLSTLEVVDTVFVSNRPIDSCSMAVSDTLCAVCFSSSITTWEKDSSKAKNIGRSSTLDSNKFSNQTFPSSLDLSKVSWNKGRIASIFATTEFQNVSTICSHHNDFVIGSQTYHSMHIISGTTRQVIGRLVGHTDGITCIKSFGDSIYSSSKDGTIKAWNPQKCTCTAHFDRHWKRVTSLEVSDVDGRVVVASGGDDQIIRVWDQKAGQEICEFTHENSSIKNIFFDPRSLTLYAILRDETEIPLPGVPAKTQLLKLHFIP